MSCFTQAKLAFERIPIPKIYHPFICGPDNQTLKDLSEPTGARISIPPHALLKDEIVISGEKEGVLRAKQAILHIYEEKVNRQLNHSRMFRNVMQNLIKNFRALTIIFCCGYFSVDCEMMVREL